MKPVQNPASASKAASRAHARPPPLLPRGAAAVSVARAQHVAPVSSRGTTAAAHANHRAVSGQHTRRHSGPRPCIFDAKVSKPTHRTKVGLWLENIETPAPLPSPAMSHSSSYPSPRRRRSTIPSSQATSAEISQASQVFWKPGSPRTPLADITPLVLAAESAAGGSFRDPQVSNVAPQQQTLCRVPNLAGAIDLLTADEARQLLLLSAQSNITLAAAINEVALARTPRLPGREAQQSFLPDTFRFDELPTCTA